MTTLSHVENLVKKLELGEKNIDIRGLWGASRALVMAHVSLGINKPIIFISFSEEESEIFARDFSFFWNELSPIYKKKNSKIKNIRFFPSWEILPYESIAPDFEICGKRIGVLDSLLNGEIFSVSTTVKALMHRLIPLNALGNSAELLIKGENFSSEDLVKELGVSGYSKTDIVENMGDFCVRGEVIDIFCPNMSEAIRIEFSQGTNETVKSIRLFDSKTQRSIKSVEEISILPAREVVLTEENLKRMGKEIEKKHTIPPEETCAIVGAVRKGGKAFGAEPYFAYLYSKTSTFFEYLKSDAIIVYDEWKMVEKNGIDFESLVKKEYQNLNLSHFPSPEENYISLNRFKQLTGRLPSLNIASLKSSARKSVSTIFFDIKSNNLSAMSHLGKTARNEYLKKVSNKFHSWIKSGMNVIFIAENQGQKDILEEVLMEMDIPAESMKSFSEFIFNKESKSGGVLLHSGYISGGFTIEELNTVFITEREIFGDRQKVRRTRAYKTSRFLSSYSDLKTGDYVVHIEYGIGVYKGVEKLDVGGLSIDFLVIAYADSDELYVPLERLHLVQKYRGADSDNVKIHRMGGKEWNKAKASVKESILKVAGELVALYAKRNTAKGFPFEADNHLIHEFEAAFEFEETPDQLSAICEVKSDMESEKVMDRLVCGDVGYGKTEVALRAALKAAVSKKQVAMLVPTTILAQQHYNTFTKRLAPFPIDVKILSRFCSPKERKVIISNIASGEADIVIGTHSMLQKSVIFKDLGLLIIDEEQRFGVAHKEKLKQYRAKIDVLTLTATPIPRTLNMAMTGTRELSVIDTPPEDRFAIHTEIIQFKDDIIKEGIEKELERKGQVFFVHNRIQNIEKVSSYLSKLMPELRIAVAHGQMNKHMLEKIMTAFCAKEYDLLLCTSIIESGLDIPSANTIFINRADKFGLAQLYQLRGRVGRSKHRAYAYLIVPPVVTDLAKKRLKAIKKLTDLGSGFKLAMHDMEIRGVGNILGHKQHGKMEVVGFDLYCQMLEESVKEIQSKVSGGKEYVPKPDTIVELNIHSGIPEEYIDDLNARLSMYRKLAMTENQEEIKELADEIADRFGKLPQLVKNLISTMYIKILAKDLFITKVKRSGEKLYISFLEATTVSPENIISLVKKYSSKNTGFSKESLTLELPDIRSDKQVIREVISILRTLRG